MQVNYITQLEDQNEELKKRLARLEEWEAYKLKMGSWFYVLSSLDKDKRLTQTMVILSKATLKSIMLGIIKMEYDNDAQYIAIRGAKAYGNSDGMNVWRVIFKKQKDGTFKVDSNSKQRTAILV